MFVLCGMSCLFSPLSSTAQWLDFQDETDTRLVLTSVASSDDEEKDFFEGDLNNDGWIDVIVVRKEPFSASTEPPKTDLLLINEGGVLTDRTTEFAPEWLANPTFARDVFIGDFDNDGWDDVVIGNTFGQDPMYYRNLGNDGMGNWLGLVDESATRLPALADDVPLICAVWGGDLTGNGFMDLYFVNYKVNSGGGTALDFLLINDGTGVFTDESAARLGDLRNSAFGTAGQIVDMDNDGDLDVVKNTTLYNVAPWNSRGTILLYNDGTGNFTNWQNITGGQSPYMFEIDDYDDNGILDVYIVDDGADYVMMGQSITADSNINYTQVDVSGGVNGFGGNVHKADLDNDGDMDIAVSDVDVDIPPCDSGRRFTILENQNGVMVDNYDGTQTWADNSYDFAFIDINNDGLVDFLTGGCAGYGLFMNDNCDLVQSSADFDLDGLPDACDPCPTNPDPNCAEDPSFPIVSTDHSAARQWNELLLHAIRRDFARPTVHARNLFHTSAVMYDAWASMDPVACPYMLGRTVNGFTCPFNGYTPAGDVQAAQEEAISYAAYRLLTHRFANSPGNFTMQQAFDTHMATLGYDIAVTSTDFSGGSAAALGNYIAQCMIDYGANDGANEAFDYRNDFYAPVNAELVVEQPGNPNLTDFNRWQPLLLEIFIDQSGNEIPGDVPEFLSPEWGAVHSFALQDADKTTNNRDGFDYEVFHDPGTPPLLQMDGLGDSDDYKWGFSTVITWSSHLDPTDGVMIDISPATSGNRDMLPTTFADHPSFYDQLNGGTSSNGHTLNPATGAAYAPNLVPRGDYARVLAEFWADGPDSETPPGHWFSLLNDVHDHPDFERRFEGDGDVLPELEWDVKAYFLLGGTMHDAAISAWGIKGWYDYLRPISAIRGMAELGQSSDPAGTNYHPAGLPLIPGYIEQIQSGDPLAGDADEFVGEIKLYAWRGHKYINNVDTDESGVDWIPASEWEPYQRPSFVTPPFAGFVSGHSTYSRSAAEVLTRLTGDAYFPGGMAMYDCPQDEFLVFEDGPSVDIQLQWATYRDAADESAMSRIWGGIHPPADDIPGRLIGIEIGNDAYDFGVPYFLDSDGDGICDLMDPVCLGDVNGDGERDVADLLDVLGDFGCTNTPCAGDLNGDGVTNTQDIINILIPNYGVPCPTP